METGSQNPETPKEIRCKTIEEVNETPTTPPVETTPNSAGEVTSAAVNSTTGTTPAARTKSKAPLPPIISNNNNRPAPSSTSDAKLVESLPAVSEDSGEIPVPPTANDASISDIRVVETSKSVDPKIEEIPTSKRKAPSKPDVPESENDVLPSSNYHHHVTVSSHTADDRLPVDTSHVSIVTIDNGKDVTITTASQTDEQEEDEDESNADDSFNSFSSSSRSSSEVGKRTAASDVPPLVHLAKDDVVLMKRVAKDVVPVRDEKKASELIASVSDDQLSIKTESSESSSCNFPYPETNKKSIQVLHHEEERRKHRSGAVPREGREVQQRRLVSSTDLLQDVGRVSPPHHISCGTSTASVTSFSNGLKLQSPTSPVVTAKNLRREASDAGSCGSFASFNSDKENASADSKLSPGVVLRRKKVCTKRRSICAGCEMRLHCNHNIRTSSHNFSAPLMLIFQSIHSSHFLSSHLFLLYLSVRIFT